MEEVVSAMVGKEDCGGLAIRYDLLLDPRHDFMTSEKDDFLERRV